MQLAVAVTAISVVLATSPVHAAPPPGDTGTDERNTTQSPPPDRTADQQRRQKPAPTFTPSEQVGQMHAEPAGNIQERSSVRR